MPGDELWPRLGGGRARIATGLSPSGPYAFGRGPSAARDGSSSISDQDIVSIRSAARGARGSRLGLRPFATDHTVSFPISQKRIIYYIYNIGEITLTFGLAGDLRRQRCSRGSRKRSAPGGPTRERRDMGQSLGNRKEAHRRLAPGVGGESFDSPGPEVGTGAAWLPQLWYTGSPAADRLRFPIKVGRGRPFGRSPNGWSQGKKPADGFGFSRQSRLAGATSPSAKGLVPHAQTTSGVQGGPWPTHPGAPSGTISRPSSVKEAAWKPQTSHRLDPRLPRLPSGLRPERGRVGDTKIRTNRPSRRLSADVDFEAESCGTIGTPAKAGTL